MSKAFRPTDSNVPKTMIPSWYSFDFYGKVGGGKMDWTRTYFQKNVHQPLYKNYYVTYTHLYSYASNM